jgi:hypothetical protein
MSAVSGEANQWRSVTLQNALRVLLKACLQQDNGKTHVHLSLVLRVRDFCLTSILRHLDVFCSISVLS